MDKRTERIDDMAEQKNLKCGGSSCGNPENSERTAEEDVEALIALLDGRTAAGDSRVKLDVVEGEGQVISRQYHHGRCDVGSPWACGTPFDILE